DRYADGIGADNGDRRDHRVGRRVDYRHTGVALVRDVGVLRQAVGRAEKTGDGDSCNLPKPHFHDILPLSQFAVSTVMRAVPVRLVASRTVAVSVCVPFASSVVFHPGHTCTQAHVCVAIVLPSTAIVYVFNPDAVPSSQTFTATVPETVALRFGLVM